MPSLNGDHCKYYLGGGWCVAAVVCPTRGKLPCMPMYEVLERMDVEQPEPNKPKKEKEKVKEKVKEKE